ncbi:cupin domain-containing protein [Burkholderia gladioli]|uniref:cupin domain-containing protein n=1 Tax=Burkholderia gladioli TaxID=28095 RepID=UPI00163F9BE7|nr:cupin domain-containing protein [Burkholderia gladioli]
MDLDTFLAELAREAYAEPVTARREAGVLDELRHPFEARALIMAGEITLRVDGVETRHGVGDVFHLPAGQAHVERYGPDGVEYRVGRK